MDVYILSINCCTVCHIYNNTQYNVDLLLVFMFTYALLISVVNSYHCIGNIALTPSVFYLFLAYLSGFVFVVVCMFMRVEIIRFVVWMVIYTSIYIYVI